MLIKNIILAFIRKKNFMYNWIAIKRKKVTYTEFPHINGRIRLHGNGIVNFGNNVRINSSEIANPIGGMEKMIISVYAPGEVIISNNVGISNSAIVCRSRIVIEENVKIGGNVKIYDNDFHSLKQEERLNSNTDISICKPISIKKNAFIGAHTIILKGIEIGENSIVGAGSVVTKSIPDNQIWAGNPARFIRNI